MFGNVHIDIYVCMYTSSCVYIKIFAWECDCSKVESLNSPHQLYSEFTQQLYAEAGAVRKTADGTDDTAENVDDSLGAALRSCHKAWLRNEYIFHLNTPNRQAKFLLYYKNLMRNYTFDKYNRSMYNLWISMWIL